MCIYMHFEIKNKFDMYSRQVLGADSEYQHERLLFRSFECFWDVVLKRLTWFPQYSTMECDQTMIWGSKDAHLNVEYIGYYNLIYADVITQYEASFPLLFTSGTQYSSQERNEIIIEGSKDAYLIVLYSQYYNLIFSNHIMEIVCGTWFFHTPIFY